MTLSNSEPLNKSLESKLKDLKRPDKFDIDIIEAKTADLIALIQSELNKQREDIRSKLPEKTNIVEIPDFPESRLFAEAYAMGEAKGRNELHDQITKILGETNHDPFTTR